MLSVYIEVSKSHDYRVNTTEKSNFIMFKTFQYNTIQLRKTSIIKCCSSLIVLKIMEGFNTVKVETIK